MCLLCSKFPCNKIHLLFVIILMFASSAHARQAYFNGIGGCSDCHQSVTCRGCHIHGDGFKLDSSLSATEYEMDGDMTITINNGDAQNASEGNDGWFGLVIYDQLGNELSRLTPSDYPISVTVPVPDIVGDQSLMLAYVSHGWGRDITGNIISSYDGNNLELITDPSEIADNTNRALNYDGQIHGEHIVATDSFSVAGKLLLSIQAPEKVKTGDNVTFRIVVNNPTAGDITNVRVISTLSQSSTFVSDVPSQGSCSLVGIQLTCTLGTLSGNTSATVDVTVNTNENGRVSLVSKAEADDETLNTNLIRQVVTADENYVPPIDPDVPPVENSNSKTEPSAGSFDWILLIFMTSLCAIRLRTVWSDKRRCS